MLNHSSLLLCDETAAVVEVVVVMMMMIMVMVVVVTSYDRHFVRKHKKTKYLVKKEKISFFFS